MPTVIYVHGRGQKQSPEKEHDKWFAALQEGLKRLDQQPEPTIAGDELKLAYWSDLFYPAPGDRPGIVAATDENPQGLANDAADAVDRLTRQYYQLQMPRRLPPPPLRASTLGAHPGLSGLPPSPATGAPVSGAFPLTSDDTRAAQYEDSFLRDVIKFFGLGFAERVRQPLAEMLRTLPLDDGLMIISHSFGTVIAYDVLVRGYKDISEARRTAGRLPLRVDTWTTMGTPLGWALDLEERIPDWAEELTVGLDDLVYNGAKAVQAMRKRVEELFEHLRPFGAVTAFGEVFHLGAKQFPPTGVERWFNIFDPNDPVSYPPLVARLGGGAVTVGDTFLYRGKQRAIDIQIRNDFASSGFVIVDLEAHNDVGYGESAQLAQLVKDFWLRSGGK